jgi:integrase
VHGFRSSFSTWAREQTDYSPEIIEAALAHKQADRVVAAYARTSYLDRRRELME